ncbi:cytochrome b [Roseomonas xinghualingensis]|uniref:cytochrome b n=1 Tax=Roseomonas xinghualingensis TaxID=2986475 RepID=UPI0021F23475|nr:cytochrome b [Roseomonas sp. SXEYE001]MCV4207948.1 cytochrome b [Roseomonas sp. SXEYE001]
MSNLIFMNSMQWRDTAQRYGAISRALHWSMAALFTWQFAGMGLKLALGRNALVSFMVGTHGPVGTLLMLLILLRGAWGLVNARQRPPHGAGLRGLAAWTGHLAIYALMFAVPALALLRQYGSGRPFAPWGIPLMPGGERIPELMAPGNAAHGLLGWILLALIAGHVAMILVHRHLWRDNVLPRMLSRTPRPAPASGG